MEVFDNDDLAYLNWMQENSASFVLNTERRKGTHYFVLHQSGCRHIATTNGMNHGAYTERSYIKLCSNSVTEIEEWLRREKPNFSTITKDCKTCNPSLGTYAGKGVQFYSSKDSVEDTFNGGTNFICFENIAVGDKYSRDALASLWGYKSRQAISRGVVTPANSNLIILFVTKQKSASMTQYNDYMSGDYLYWEGEEKGGNDSRIINSIGSGDAIHLFFREKDRSDFTYMGVIELESYTEHDDSPLEAVFRITGSIDEDSDGHVSTLHFDASDSPTTRQAVVSSRVGQGIYRQNLVKLWKRCSITDTDLLEVLIASHIKPWKDSSNTERLDPYNGLLLAPNLDALFDKGYISFHDNGAIILSKSLSSETFFLLGITSHLRLRQVFEKCIPYLEYHRENVFKG